MSNLNQDTQSKKPLGSGAQAGATSENRILYVLLFVLIGVFFWKVSSDDDGIKNIAQDKSMPSIKYEEVTSTTNRNVDVEIIDADLLAIAEINPSKQKKNKINKDIPEKSEINPDFYKSYNLKQMPITKSGGFDDIPAYDYNYIFAGNVNVPEGTSAGIDDDGFAILIEKIRTRSLIGGAMAQAASQNQFHPKVGDIFYENNATNFNAVAPSSSNGIERVNKYPSTGIAYGSEIYPLDDTLAWHPYESLAYINEKKKVFVAEKVRAMPTARDLEQYIPPSALGDRDTRMGYGVVIRPRK